MTSFKKFESSGDFNCTTSNFGWDTKGLEEGSFARFHTSIASFNVDIKRSNGSGSGRSSNPIAQDLFPSFLQITICEDKADIALDMRKKAFNFEEAAFRNESLYGATNHCILAHQHNAITSERLPNLVHLLT